MKFGWSDLSNSPHTNTQLIFLKWIQADMTMPSTCHMRGSPPVQVFQFILMASDLSYWFAMSFIIHQAFLITSNVNLTKKEKKKKKKKRLFWLSLSGATNWVLAPPVDGISTVSNLITPLDSYNSYISFFFFFKKTQKQTNKQTKETCKWTCVNNACMHRYPSSQNLWFYGTQTSPQADRETLTQS